MRLDRWLPADARWCQIAFLASFLAAGVAVLGFEVPPWQPPLVLAAACGTQWAMMRALRTPDVGYRSAVITALGLSLLLRSDWPWLPPLAAAMAIAAKFLIRVRAKHLFNPATFGLAAAMLLTSHAWCSPSQWGEASAVLAWLAILGLAVVSRAFRTDISVAFLGTWVVLKAGRVLYLEQRPEVLAHQLAVGSLILFAFFMISDPKTTPDHRWGRVAFAAAVAGLGFYLQHGLWWQNGLIWALFLLSPLVPLIDRFLPAPAYAWGRTRSVPCPSTAVALPASLPS